MNNKIGKPGTLFGFWSLIGIGLGLSIGFSINSMILGIVMGLCLSILFGTISERIYQKVTRIRIK